MDSRLKLKLIKEAKSLLDKNSKDVVHDKTHARKTYLMAKKIAASIDQKYNKDILEVISWWHDVHLTKEDEHDSNTTEKVARYISKQFETKKEKEIIYDSIKNHEWGKHPKYVEGKILFDADKLEILSKERFKRGVESIRKGEYPRELAIKNLSNIYNNWFPNYFETLYFDYSKKIFEDKIEGAEKRFESTLNDLKSAG